MIQSRLIYYPFYIERFSFDKFRWVLSFVAYLAPKSNQLPNRSAWSVVELVNQINQIVVLIHIKPTEGRPKL